MSDPDRGIPDSSETTTHPSASTSAFPSAPAPPRPSDVDADAPPPPSTVADYDYPNVPDTTEPQQAATGPGQGGVVNDPAEEKLPFKEQVNGYAKKFAGKVFKNEGEQQFGEKKLKGEI